MWFPTGVLDILMVVSTLLLSATVTIMFAFPLEDVEKADVRHRTTRDGAFSKTFPVSMGVIICGGYSCGLALWATLTLMVARILTNYILENKVSSEKARNLLLDVTNPLVAVAIFSIMLSTCGVVPLVYYAAWIAFPVAVANSTAFSIFGRTFLCAVAALIVGVIMIAWRVARLERKDDKTVHPNPNS